MGQECEPALSSPAETQQAQSHVPGVIQGNGVRVYAVSISLLEPCQAGWCCLTEGRPSAVLDKGDKGGQPFRL